MLLSQSFCKCPSKKTLKSAILNLEKLLSQNKIFTEMMYQELCSHHKQKKAAKGSCCLLEPSNR